MMDRDEANASGQVSKERFYKGDISFELSHQVNKQARVFLGWRNDRSRVLKV
jgi:hypothetical protein